MAILKLVVCSVVFSLSLLLSRLASAEAPPASNSERGQVPVLVMAPPAVMVAHPGDVLLLEASADQDKEVRYVWFFDGKRVCGESLCRLSLAAELEAGRYSLGVVVYNRLGSSATEHQVVVYTGVREGELAIRSLATRTKSIEPSNAVPGIPAGGIVGWTKGGMAFLASRKRPAVLGALPRRIEWAGNLRAEENSVARVVVSQESALFVLGPSDVQLLQVDGTRRVVRLHAGGLRLQVVRTGEEEKDGDQLQVEAGHVVVRLKRGHDVFVARGDQTVDDRTLTCQRIISISGTVQVVLAADQAPMELPPGLQLTACNEGVVLPIGRAESKELKMVIEKTYSLADMMREKRDNVDSPEKREQTIVKASELALEGDYFEVVNILSPYESQGAQDARIPYFLGLAFKGLYETDKAEAYFAQARDVSPDFADAPWQLGMLYLDDKRWDEAALALATAYDRLPSEDTRRAEYPYYAAVAAFNQGREFWARDQFSRALLWTRDLDAALKGSAATFLDRMNRNKWWTLVAPLGVQWDGNALGLERDGTIPATYKKASVFRVLAGANATRENPAPEVKPGSDVLIHGFSANAFSAYHVSDDYRAFDMVSLGGGVFQKLWVSEIGPDGGTPQTRIAWRLAEDLSALIVNGDLQNLGVVLGGSQAPWEISLSLTYDYKGHRANPEVASDSGELKEKWVGAGWPGLWGGVYGLEGYLSQKITLPSDTDTEYGVEIGGSPSHQWAFAQNRGMLRLAGTFAYARALNVSEWRVATGVQGSVNWFIAPWIMSQTSLAYDVSRDKTVLDSGKTVLKPTASCLLSAIL